MANVDGNIKIGIDFGTKEVRDSLQELSKNLDAVKNQLKNLDNAFKQTSDRATFEKQLLAFDEIKGKLIVLAKEYQALNDVIQKSGSSFSDNKFLEGMANSYKLQFSRIMRDVLDFKAKLKAQFGESADYEVGVELDEPKFNKFVSKLTDDLSKASNKAGKNFNIKPNIDLSSVKSELDNGFGGKSSFKVIAESMNFSDLGADIKRNFVGNLQNAASDISKIQSKLNGLSGSVKNTYEQETFLQQYNDLKQLSSEIPELQNRFIQLLGVASQLYDGKLPSSVRNIANSFTEMSNTASKSISQIRTAIETNLNSSVLDMSNIYGNMFVDDFSFSYDDSVVKGLVNDLQRDLDAANIDVKVDLDSIELGVESVETGGILSVIKDNTERISNSIPKFSGSLMSNYSTGVDNTSSTSTNDELIAQLEQDQLRAVEKFNEARRQGVDITQALTQDELALTRSYYEGLKVEERRNQERAKQQKTASFNDKVDAVVASAVIDLPKEESKIERLHRLAQEVKADFANEAEISQVKAKFGELKRLASEIKIEISYNNNLSAISNQLGTVKKAAEGIRFNFAQTGDIEQAQKGVEALKNKITELKAKRDSLNEAYEKGIISEIDFRADTVDIDKAISELESETVQIEVDINASKSFNLGSLVNLSGNIGIIKGVLSTTVNIMKKLIEFFDYMVEKFKEAVDTAKKLGSALSKVASVSFDLSRGILKFSHDALDAIGITEKLKDTMSSIGFGDLVGADLLADSIRKLASSLKELSSDSLDFGVEFQSAYLRIKDTFGDGAEEMYDFAKTAIDTMGMSETSYMKIASRYGAFIRTFIKDTKSLASTTNALVQLTADSAAQMGISINDAFIKLQSGLKGNVNAIEELGIPTKIKDLDMWLESGAAGAQFMSKSFSELSTSVQNSLLAFYMLDKAGINGTIGYAAKMMNTFSGQLRIVKSQFEDLKTVLGSYLMQALVPVLKVINLILAKLIDLANMIGKVFGLKDKYELSDSIVDVDISGVEDTYKNGAEAAKGAIATQEKLAKATEKTTKATEKSAKAAKKALAPFHKLNILQNNDKSSSPSLSPSPSLSSSPKVQDIGGVGSSIKATPKLDTSNIGDSVSEWLKKFKKAVEKGDWYEVGSLLGEKINELISKLDFKKYTKKFEKGAETLADIFNGLVETIHFDELGVKLGDGVNLIAHTINTFLDKVNFEEIGTSISELLRNFMATADWEEIGKLWSQKTRILIDLLHGFVKDMDEVNLETNKNGWQELGTSLGEFVNSALDLDWEKLGGDVGKVINGLADTIISFNEEVDFVGISSKIADGFNKLVDELDGEKIGKAVSSTINSAISSVKKFFEKADLLELGVKIGDAIGTALADINWDDAADTVIVIADGILKLLSGAIDSLSKKSDKIFEGVESFATSIIDWINDPENQDAIADVINKFTDMIADLVGDIDWDRLYKGISKVASKINWKNIIPLLHLGDFVKLVISVIFDKELFISAIDLLGDLVVELFKPLINTIGLISEFIGSIIGKRIVNGFKFIKDIKEKFKNLEKFFNNFIPYLIHIISSKFKNLKTKLSETWDNIKTTASTKWEEIKSAVSGTIDNIKTALSTNWEEITTKLSETWDNIKTTASTKWEEIKSEISGIVKNLKTDIESKWGTLKTNTLSVFDSIKNGIVNLFTNIGTSIKNPINGIISLVESMVNKIIEGVNGAIDTLNKFNIDVPDGVPVIGGQNWGFSIEKISSITIPRLADGAVIKPNQRFLAELGDQTRGINIETPLSTMLDAFRGALVESGYGSGGNITIPVYIGGELLDEVVVNASNRDTYRNNGR